VGKLAVFQNVSLDGYFVDRNSSMNWAKNDNDEEFNAFASENAKGGGVLVFGRVTYEMMFSFWPTPQAREMFPVVAERMNEGPKVVFSRKMEKASWNNTQLVKGDLVSEMHKMKARPGEGMVILGSGSLVAQLAPAGLIDVYQVVVNPVVLGGGRTMFEGLKDDLRLKLTKSRTFKNGKVFLCYELVK
jgi:dihydrofolate reductase